MPRSNFKPLPRLSAIVALALAAAAAGGTTLSCTTPTKVTDQWRDPAYVVTPMKRIIVFGGHMTETNRRSLEDGFVQALNEHGVLARPSYELFPEELPDPKQARGAVEQAGFDGILVAVEKSVQERTTYVPGTTTGGFWTGYYGPGWGTAWSPGYVVTDELVNFETTLWDPRGDGRLVWTATTETKNPSSGPDFIKSLTNKLIPQLEKSGVIPPKATS